MFGLASCSGPASVLDPAGPAASAIATLWWAMLAGGTLIFASVTALLAAAFFKRRPTPEVTRLWLLGGGIVLPLLCLTVLLGHAMAVGERLLPIGGRGERIDVIGRQWDWVFVHHRPDAAAKVSYNLLHLPSESPIDLHISSLDVIHSFWIPRLGGKIDATPGHAVVHRLQARQPGRYRALCAEFCGTGHTQMMITVEVHTPEGYRQILETLEDVDPAQIGRHRQTGALR